MLFDNVELFDGELIIPTTFEECLSYEQQVIWLMLNKQARLVQGENITLSENEDGTVTISSTGGSGEGHTYTMESVAEPAEGYQAQYKLVDDNGNQSGVLISIPEVTHGEDGFSPVASVTPIENGARISITDKNGTTSTDIMNGTNGTDGTDGVGIVSISFVEEVEKGNKYRVTLSNDNTYDFIAPKGATGATGERGETGATGEAGANGRDGVDGISPTATVEQTEDGAIITIQDANGTTTANLTNGANGTNGADGFSPIATVEQTDDGAIVSIQDANGTTTANLTNGADGDDGVTPDISASATVDSTVGTPHVIVTKGGTAENPTFTFAFSGLKGDQGAQGVPGSGEDGVGIADIVLLEETEAGNTYNIELSNGESFPFTAPRGPQGNTGATGATGETGATGAAGFSPRASVTQTDTGATISIEDETGTTTADITNGTNGTNGSDGVSPVANVVKSGTNTVITITDVNGTTTATVVDGNVVEAYWVDNNAQVGGMLDQIQFIDDILTLTALTAGGEYITKAINIGAYLKGTFVDDNNNSQNATSVNIQTNANGGIDIVMSNGTIAKTFTIPAQQWTQGTALDLNEGTSYTGDLSGITAQKLTNQRVFTMEIEDITSGESQTYSDTFYVVPTSTAGRFYVLAKSSTGANNYTFQDILPKIGDNYLRSFSISTRNNQLLVSYRTVTPSGTSSETSFTWDPVSDLDIHNVPNGGTTGQVLTKQSDNNYDADWETIHQVPSGGASGQILTKASASDYDLTWSDPASGGGEQGLYIKRLIPTSTTRAWFGSMTTGNNYQLSSEVIAALKDIYLVYSNEVIVDMFLIWKPNGNGFIETRNNRPLRIYKNTITITSDGSSSNPAFLDQIQGSFFSMGSVADGYHLAMTELIGDIGVDPVTLSNGLTCYAFPWHEGEIVVKDSTGGYSASATYPVYYRFEWLPYYSGTTAFRIALRAKNEEINISAVQYFYFHTVNPGTLTGNYSPT